MAQAELKIDTVAFINFLFDRYAAGNTPSINQILMAYGDYQRLVDNPPVGGGND